MCDVSRNSARELTEQFVQDLELSPGLEMVLDSTPGFERGRKERGELAWLAPPRHRGGVKKPDDHVGSPVSPLTPASKFLHKVDLSPSLPMVPHNTLQKRTVWMVWEGRSAIDFITPTEAANPAIEVLREMQDDRDRDRRPAYSAPSPTPIPSPSSPSHNHEREAALSVLTDLRDLDDALGEARAICISSSLLIPKWKDRWVCRER